MSHIPPQPAPELAAAASSVFNFAAHILACNATRATHPAFIDDTRTLHYGELASEVRRFASALQRAGVRPEERVALLMHDSCDWPVVFLGCLYAGAVPVALNTLLTAQDYAYMLGHCSARYLVVSAALVGVAQAGLQLAQAANSCQVQALVVCGAPDGAAPPGIARADAALPPTPTPTLAQFVAGASPGAPYATNGDAPGFWLYSSGSTGRPKGTVHTHNNLRETASLYGQGVMGIAATDVCFSAAKLFFAYGLGNALTFPLSVGATTLLMAERPTPQAVFKRWRGEAGGLAAGQAPVKPSIFFGAPTGFAGMLASPELPARAELTLRLCSSAGEALPAELGERVGAHLGCPVVDGIGSTEMLHVYLSNTPTRVRYGSTGWPVPGYEIALRDDAGQVVADGEVGDLFVRGPSAALLYWGNRAKSGETFQGAWTKSGDKYVRNADGSYTYSGRGDDMLKVSGIYVSPFEVESALAAHEAVVEAAVIGVADAHGLTKPVAYVVLKAGHSATQAQLQAFVKDRLAPYKYPRSIHFVDELPKTATGKIQRFKLRAGQGAADGGAGSA